jgi:hypothetical protein
MDEKTDSDEEPRTCKWGRYTVSGATKLGKLIMWFIQNVTKINMVITILVVGLIVIGGGVIWGFVKKILGYINEINEFIEKLWEQVKAWVLAAIEEIILFLEDIA